MPNKGYTEKITEFVNIKIQKGATFTTKEVIEAVGGDKSNISKVLRKYLKEGKTKIVRFDKNKRPIPCYGGINYVSEPLLILPKNSKKIRELKLMSIGKFCACNGIPQASSLQTKLYDRAPKSNIEHFIGSDNVGYVELYKEKDLQRLVEEIKNNSPRQLKLINSVNSVESIDNPRKRLNKRKPGKYNFTQEKILAELNEHPNNSYSAACLSHLIKQEYSFVTKTLRRLWNDKQIKVTDVIRSGNRGTLMYQSIHGYGDTIKVIESTSKLAKSYVSINEFLSCKKDPKIKELLITQIKKQKVPSVWIHHGTGYFEKYKSSDLRNILTNVSIPKHKPKKETVKPVSSVPKPQTIVSKPETVNSKSFSFSIFGFQINIRKKQTISKSEIDCIEI